LTGDHPQSRLVLETEAAVTTSRTAFAFAFALLIPVASPVLAQPVGAEFRANTYTTGDQTNVSVAMAPGSFIVVWQSAGTDDPTGGIYGQRFTSASKPARAGSQFRVNTTTTGSQTVPSVATDGTGNFVVVWSSLSVDQTVLQVLGQRYASTGAPVGPEFRINTFTTGTPPFTTSAPSVASDPNGNFVVVWHIYDHDGQGYGVFGQRFASTGVPLGPEFRVNTITTAAQRKPAVARATDGSFVVAWHSNQSLSYHRIYAQRYDAAGAPLGTEFQVNTFTGHQQYNPSVASDGPGNFMVAWQSYNQDLDKFEVYARRYASSGAALTTPFRVNTVITYQQTNPRAASNAAGDMTVVWQSQDAGGFGIYGQRYAPSGAPAGGQFLVNSYQTGEQRYPAVASSGSAFVVAWQGQYDDGAHLGIFGKRYPGPGDVNGDGVVNVNDVFYLINFLFAQGASPIGPADINGNGSIDVADVFYLINYLFAQGAFPK
jgi:hypothetical protein